MLYLKGCNMRVRRIAAAMCLATGFLAGGEISATATPLACTYRAQQISGLPGGNGAGQLVETDGDRHFVGWGFFGTAMDPYPHGTIWRDGSVVADFGALNAVNSVNRSGDAVGVGFGSTASIAVPHGGQPIRLAKPPQMTRAGVSGASISDDGLIVGMGRFDDGTTHGLSWSLATAGTAFRDLGVLGTVPVLRPAPGLREVSDTGGRIVGSIKPVDRFRAVAGTAGNLVPLTGVDPNLDSEATDIAGRFIIGTGTVPGQGTGAVLWENGSPRLLPITGSATDVNSSGVVTGYEGNQAVVLDGGVRTLLPPLPGHSRTRAMAVTEDGRVLGWSNTATDDFVDSVPVVWTCG